MPFSSLLNCRKPNRGDECRPPLSHHQHIMLLTAAGKPIRSQLLSCTCWAGIRGSATSFPTNLPSRNISRIVETCICSHHPTFHHCSCQPRDSSQKRTGMGTAPLRTTRTPKGDHGIKPQVAPGGMRWLRGQGSGVAHLLGGPIQPRGTQ